MGRFTQKHLQLMAMPSSATAGCCFCFSSPSCSSHRHAFTHRSLTTTTTTRSIRLRLIARPARLLLFSASSAPDPPPDQQDEQDDRYGFQIQVSKTGKRNRRLVRARVRVHAPLEPVWETLTDYEGLADFIPGLAECRLLQKDHRFARLYQVGEQDLALGFKFNAKGTVDCFEGEMELMPDAGTPRRREIAFNMIDGDFSFFQGKWSVQEVDTSTIGDQGREASENQKFQTTLSYLVELEPKLWVPVRLLEGRICSEIKTNLVSIREQAQRIHRLQHEGAVLHYGIEDVNTRRRLDVTEMHKSMRCKKTGQDLTL